MKSFRPTEGGQKKVVNVYSKDTGKQIDSHTPKMGQRADALKRDIEYSEDFDRDTMYLRIENE